MPLGSPADDVDLRTYDANVAADLNLLVDELTATVPCLTVLVATTTRLCRTLTAQRAHVEEILTAHRQAEGAATGVLRQVRAAHNGRADGVCGRCGTAHPCGTYLLTGEVLA